jgi:O-antigen ligase
MSDRYCLWRRAVDVIVAKPFTGTGINTYSVAHAKYDTVRAINYILVQTASTQIRQNPDGSVSFISGGHVLTSDAKQETFYENGIKHSIYRDPDGKYYVYNDLVVRNYYAHNGYLQLAAEIGLPGIFFFLLFLLMFFRKVLRGLRPIRGSTEEYTRLGLLAGLLAFLIYAAADNNLQSPPSLMMFWYLAGISMARQGSHSLQNGSVKP